MNAGMAWLRHMTVALQGSEGCRTNQLNHGPHSNIQGTFYAFQKCPNSTELQYSTFPKKVSHNLPWVPVNYNVNTSGGNVC